MLGLKVAHSRNYVPQIVFYYTTQKTDMTMKQQPSMKTYIVFEKVMFQLAMLVFWRATAVNIPNSKDIMVQLHVDLPP